MIRSLNKGFTLVEMLIYVGVFLVVSTASITFLISLDDFIYQYRIETALYKTGTNIMEQVILSVRQADSVDLGNTVLNTPSAGELTVLDGVEATNFELDSGVLNMSIGGVDLGSMAMDGVGVEEFTVYHYGLTEGELVRVKIRLSGTLNGVSKDLTLYGGAVVRGSI